MNGVALVLTTMWMAPRGSLTALLLWPGGLFYLGYAMVPYPSAHRSYPFSLLTSWHFLAAATTLTPSLDDHSLAAVRGELLPPRDGRRDGRLAGKFVTAAIV